MTGHRIKPFTPDDFYRAYAIAMLNWQKVETALFRLYHELFGEAGHLVTSSSAYYSMDSFSGKMRLVEGAAKVMLADPSLIDRWKRIRRDVLAASGERNVLAHLPAELQTNPDESLSLVLAPPPSAPPTMVREKKRKYDAQGCEDLAMRFESLSADIDRFTDEIAAVNAELECITKLLGLDQVHDGA